MIAIRQIQEVKSGAVTVALPVDFHAKRVEIIILAIEESNNGAQNLQDLLLAAPTLTDDELQDYEKVREWMSQWNVNDF
ncbi:hypothetical protein L0337_10165 [candidate division KSB1 bacterium]|nr:hypothetical protein [candidate division KSB1 bacterium]